MAWPLVALLRGFAALCALTPAAGGRGGARVAGRGVLGQGVLADPTAAQGELLSDLQQKGSSILARAESAAASASASANRAEYLGVQNELKTAKMRDLLARTTAAGERAARLEREAGRAEEELEAFAKRAADKAARLAVEAVKDMFSSKYRELESWRQEVLTDPYAKAKTEATLAVVPYDEELRATYARIGDLSAEADALETQSDDLLAKAGELAAEARETLETNPAGARQDFADARRLRAQGQQLASEARAAQASAASLNATAARTLEERQAAALRAAHRANPQSLPPMDVDPETAYLPPLPPAEAAPQAE